MAYEVDFIGISEETKDADAIAMRWKTATGGYKIGVYDGGIQAYGVELQNLLNSYYFGVDEYPKVIDFVVVSHSDQDHTTGLKTILENYTVKALYMNRPWLYTKDLIKNKNHGNITEKSLERRLKEQYKYIAELEEIAEVKGIPIYEAFQGQTIEGKLTVLSPTKELYLDLVIESDKTPLQDRADSINESFSWLSKSFHTFAKYVKSLIESWFEEKLKENVETSAENEMSVVLLGEMDEENFLLTGDAGIRGLDAAIVYSEEIGKEIINTVDFLQIPHHGGRHNVSPSILNRMIGFTVAEGTQTGKTAFVSAGKNSDHPLQMVVNAFIRRGVKVYKTNGQTIHHHRGNMPARSGWTTLSKLNFEEKVEEW